MNEIARDHFPEEKRVVVEWTAGPRDTPIRFTVGPVTGELPPNTPTIVPANIAQVITEGHNVLVSAAPDDYEAPKAPDDESASHPGGSGDVGTMKVLDGPGGAPATVSSVNPDMRGGSINGGGEGAAGDPTNYPETMSRAMGGDLGEDAASTETGDADEEQDDSEDEEPSEEGEDDSENPTLAKAQELQGKTIGKMEEAIAAGVDLPVLKAALDAEQGAGPDKQRSGAVEALTKAIEQHPDNTAS